MHMSFIKIRNNLRKERYTPFLEFIDAFKNIDERIDKNAQPRGVKGK